MSSRSGSSPAWGAADIQDDQRGAAVELRHDLLGDPADKCVRYGHHDHSGIAQTVLERDAIGTGRLLQTFPSLIGDLEMADV